MLIIIILLFEKAGVTMFFANIVIIFYWHMREIQGVRLFWSKIKLIIYYYCLKCVYMPINKELITFKPKLNPQLLQILQWSNAWSFPDHRLWRFQLIFYEINRIRKARY